MAMISQQSDVGGIGEVINLINGGYDCCPSSNLKTEYGHSAYRIWWFIDIIYRWTGTYPFPNLNEISINNCPLVAKINCSKMLGDNCWS